MRAFSSSVVSCLAVLLLLPAAQEAAAQSEGAWPRVRVQTSLLVPAPFDAPAPVQVEVGGEWNGTHGWLGAIQGGAVMRSLGFDLFVQVEGGWRYTAPFGLTAELAAAVGYRHQFVRGDLYRGTEGGGVERGPDWGLPFGTGQLSLGVGWDFRRNNLAPLSVAFVPWARLTYPQWDQAGFELGAGLRLTLL